MTVGVNQASIAAAATVARHSRHGNQKATGFDEALASVKQRPDQPEPGTEQKSKATAHHERPHSAHDAPVKPDDRTIAKQSEVVSSSDTAVVSARKHDLPDIGQDPEPDDLYHHDQEPDADEEAGLPTQIRAEQTITALMALAPIGRRTQAAGNHVEASAKGTTTDDSHRAGSQRIASAGTESTEGHPATGKDASSSQAPKRAAPSEAPVAGQTGLGKGDLGKVEFGSADRGKTEVAKDDLDKGDAGKVAVDKVGATTTGPTTNQAAYEVMGKQATAAETRPAAARSAPAERKVDVKDKGEVDRRGARAPQAEAPKAQGNMKAETAKPVAADSGDDPSNSDSAASGNSPRDARLGEPQAGPTKVAVVSQQAAPAPAAPQLSTNVTAIVSAIAGDQSRRPVSAGAADPLQTFRNAQPMRSLRIELHPADLGIVTANLKTAGGQLSVELQVDNHDAYHRLSADSDAIVKSLRSIGYDIDRVSIQQPQAATNTVVRTDQSAGAGSPSRDTASFHSGNPGAGGDQSGARANGRGERGDAQRNEQSAQIRQDRAGGGVYI